MTPRSRIWVGRVALLAMTLLFVMISFKFVVDPQGAATSSGLSVAASVGATNLRASFGAFPLALAAILSYHLVSLSRLRMGLAIGAAFIATALLVRLGGAVVDDTMGQSGPLLIVESVVLVLAVAATLTVGGASNEGKSCAHRWR
jgi:hypothetical protein